MSIAELPAAQPIEVVAVIGAPSPQPIPEPEREFA